MTDQRPWRTTLLVVATGTTLAIMALNSGSGQPQELPGPGETLEVSMVDENGDTILGSDGQPLMVILDGNPDAAISIYGTTDEAQRALDGLEVEPSGPGLASEQELLDLGVLRQKGDEVVPAGRQP